MRTKGGESPSLAYKAAHGQLTNNGSVWQRYLIIVGLTLVMVMLRGAFGLPKPPLFSFFILPVCIGAYLEGASGGWLAIIIAALGNDYFLLEPVYSLSIWDPGERADAGIFLLNGAAFITLIKRLRETTRSAKQSEARERALREQWEQVLRISPAAICSFRRDSEGQVSFPFSTDTIKAFYPIEPSDLAMDGAPAMAFIHPADLPRVQEDIDRSAEDLSPFRAAWRVNHPTKGEVWVECHSSPVAQTDGSTIWHGLMLDITERKRAEAVSESTRAAYATLVNQLPQLVWTCTADGACDFLSEQWTQFTGIPAAALLGRGWLAQIHPDDRTSLLEAWTSSVAQGTVFKALIRIRRYDGTYHWFDSRANPVFDQAGRIIKWLGSDTDIQSTHDLNERLAQQALLLELSLEPVLVWSSSEGIEYWNQGCEQYYGFSGTEAIGRSSHELLQTRLPDGEPWFIETLLQQGTWVGELIHTTKQGDTLNVLSRMQVIDYQGRTLVLESNRDITERKRTEESLRLWAETFERAEVALCISDAVTNTFRAVNATYAQERGYSPEELIGKSVFSVYPADRLDETKKIVTEVDKAGHGSFESDHLTRDGRHFPVWMDITTLKDRAGQAQSRIACAFDISLQKRSQALLEQREAEVRQLLDALPVLVAYIDQAERYRIVNKTYEQWYARPCTEVEGYTVREVLGEIRYSMVQTNITRALSGESVTFELKMPYPDGKDRFIRLTYVPHIDGKGTVLGMFIIIEDLTEMHRTAEALREARDDIEKEVRSRTLELWQTNAALTEEIAERQRTQQALLETSADLAEAQRVAHIGNWHLDLTTQGVRWSEELFRIFDLTPSPLKSIYKTFLNRVHPEDRERIRAVHAEAETEGRPFDVEYRITVQDGTQKTIREVGYAKQDSAGGVVALFGTTMDITERRVAEEARLTEALAQRQALVREVHHRIKNHLQGLVGLLARFEVQCPAAAKYFQQAEAQTNVIATIHGLQAQSGHETAGLVGVITAIIETAQRFTDVPIELHASADPSLSHVHLQEISSVPVALIINELVLNAIKHGNYDAMHPKLDIYLKSSTETFCLRIANPGPLTPATPGRTGTGLGLARLLLPRQGASLEVVPEGDEVQATLRLTPPVIVTGDAHAY